MIKEVRTLREIPEQWKRYKDTDFWFSDQGRAKHVFKNGSEHLLTGTKRVNNKGNTQLVIRVNSRKQKAIKEFVWETFKGERPKDKVIVHKNGLFADNSIYNLEAITRKECGIKYGGNNTSRRKIINLDTGAIYSGTREAGRKTFCSRQTISDACNGIRKKSVVNVAWWDGMRPYKGIYKNEF